MTQARYRIRTWDPNRETYTPQRGIGRSSNLTLWQLRERMKDLRRIGFSCHRVRLSCGEHIGDAEVLIERDDSRIGAWK
jgi:hypothetical protein